MKQTASIRRTLCGFLLLSVAAPLSAQSIYKCTHGGRIEYTDHPCPTGTGELIHKADDSEVIDQYLDLGQTEVAKNYATSRHLEALYQSRLDAYTERMKQRAERATAEAMAQQQRDEQARQQALLDQATERGRLQAENDLLRQQNQQYRDQQTQPVDDYAPAVWAPPYWDHSHDHGKPRPPAKPPVYHPCRQLAGGRVEC